jgi:hypothetical protein
MRMPWQRRSAGRAEPENAAAPEAMPRAWRSAPPLAGSAGGPPPLTARSVELADALSRRLRSTRERPPLLHRAGFPDAAAPGIVRGIAVASPLAAARSRSASSGGLGDDETASDSAPETTAAALTTVPRVKARRNRQTSLTSVDPAMLVLPAREAAQRTEPEESHADDMAGTDASPAPTVVPAGLQRTVIRRRMGAPGTRPLGLQAPLDDAATEASAERSVELERSAHQATTEPAPHTVTAEVGRLHRADVGNVRVHRGEEAERVAADAHARAVTRGGEVFIPDTAGRLDTGAGRGLLAHELTHVIQQRRLGTSVPLEHSPAGRRLESEAAMTERHVRGDAGAPPPPPAAQPAAPAPAVATPSQPADEDDAKATARDIQDELIASGRAYRMPDGSIVFPGSGMHLPEQRPSPAQQAVVMQRAPDDSAPMAADDPLPATNRAYAPASDTGFLPMPQMPAPQNAAPSPAAAPAVTQTWPQPVAAAAPASTPSPAVAAAPQTEQAPTPEPAPPIDIDDLARRVYGQVRTQLRSELLIDRERAGLLTDFR